MNQSIGWALLLSFLAGAATMLGGALAFVIKKENLAALAVGLGFSSGVMIYVSFRELLPQAILALQAACGVRTGEVCATGLFFVGIILAWGVDYFLPSHHVEMRTLDPADKLKRLGFLTAVILAVHNFPEGLVTFAAALKSVALGGSVALAVAVHNIPEGVAVALPVFHATGSRKQAFWYSAFSGLAEPAGALVGFLLLRQFLHEAVFGVLFAVIAGMMVYISLDELLPTAHEYGEGHHVIWGIIGGMALMAVSLWLF